MANLTVRRCSGVHEPPPELVLCAVGSRARSTHTKFLTLPTLPWPIVFQDALDVIRRSARRFWIPCRCTVSQVRYFGFLAVVPCHTFVVLDFLGVYRPPVSYFGISCGYSGRLSSDFRFLARVRSVCSMFFNFMRLSRREEIPQRLVFPIACVGG